MCHLVSRRAVLAPGEHEGLHPRRVVRGRAARRRALRAVKLGGLRATRYYHWMESAKYQSVSQLFR